MPIVTRRELYDLVWSKPITKLAETFGISDVGLAKICDRHRIPTPPRGYWAKKEVGKKVKQAIFVQVDDPLLDRVEIGSHRDKVPEPVREIIDARRAERKLSRPSRPKTLTPPEVVPVRDPHRAIRATALALRDAPGSKAGVVKAIGPGLSGISIGAESVERVIFILDRLARTCESRGLILVPKDRCLGVSVADDTVRFEITEKPRQVPHVLTERELFAEERRRRRDQQLARGRAHWNVEHIFDPLPPKYDTVRSGELGLRVHNWGEGLRCSWNDGKTQTLETLIDDIVDGLEAHLVAIRLRREKTERAEAERNELRRRHGLVKARREREVERKRLLNKIIRTEREVAQLRNWLVRQEQHLTTTTDTDLHRMGEWVRDRLGTLVGFLDPARLVDELQARKLFPKIDELHDPLGEPPPERTWW